MNQRQNEQKSTQYCRGALADSRILTYAPVSTHTLVMLTSHTIIQPIKDPSLFGSYF